MILLITPKIGMARFKLAKCPNTTKKISRDFKLSKYIFRSIIISLNDFLD
jgi:hypothetical protein